MRAAGGAAHDPPNGSGSSSFTGAPSRLCVTTTGIATGRSISSFTIRFIAAHTTSSCRERLSAFASALHLFGAPNSPSRTAWPNRTRSTTPSSARCCGATRRRRASLCARTSTSSEPPLGTTFTDLYSRHRTRARMPTLMPRLRALRRGRPRFDTGPKGFACAQLRLRPLEFMPFGAHSSPCSRRRSHASHTASSPGRDLLLSPLRSTLFGDAFAASQG